MIVIREENPEDIAAIHQVNEMAFNRAAEADLVDELRRKEKVIRSCVAEQDGEVVGHILFSPVTIESGANKYKAAGLAPMAVLPQYQNRGIGSLLVKDGIRRCREAGYNSVVVLGHSEYYPRFGFVPAGRYGLKSEFNVADEVFMALELSEEALKNCPGVVKYQPEFNQF